MTEDRALAAAAIAFGAWHGRTWGNWTLHCDTHELILEEDDNGRRIECVVDLDALTAYELVDWIYHMKGKIWHTPATLDDFLNAIEEIIDPRYIFNPKAPVSVKTYLNERFSTGVSVRRASGRRVRAR